MGEERGRVKGNGMMNDTKKENLKEEVEEIKCEIRSIRGYCTPNQKLSCFVIYLKIINTFYKK